MPKRSSKKKPTDADQLPAPTPEQPAEAPLQESVPADGKNRAAVALGRLGGKKGGLARAAKLTKSQRREIARKAALARWKKKGG